MPEKLKIINVTLVAALACDLYINQKNRAKYKDIQEMNQLLQMNFEHAQYVIEYLGNKLADNEIEIDEFDMIAINNPMM